MATPQASSAGTIPLTGSGWTKMLGPAVGRSPPPPPPKHSIAMAPLLFPRFWVHFERKQSAEVASLRPFASPLRTVCYVRDEMPRPPLAQWNATSSSCPAHLSPNHWNLCLRNSVRDSDLWVRMHLKHEPRRNVGPLRRVGEEKRVRYYEHQSLTPVWEDQLVAEQQQDRPANAQN